jgi:hypothetical protein
MNIRPWFWLCCLLLTVTAALVALPGCSGSKSEAPKAVENAAKAAEPPLAPPVEPGLDIGDVEAGGVISATGPPEAITDQVSVENMETARKRMSMATVTVKPPYPQKLIIRVTLAPQVSYEKQPVVVRGKLRRDEQPIEPEFSTMVAKGGPIGDTTIKYDFDAMQGLAAPPDTMLVYARFDAYLMPKGTPPTGLDPKTAQSDQHTELLSNPVRINFVK